MFLTDESFRDSQLQLHAFFIAVMTTYHKFNAMKKAQLF